MKKDLISVIVPVYNVEEYLPKCIESLINQTYKNLEIILVDDGSPDGSPKICDEYAKKDKRIKVIHKKNGGVASARNLGLDNATGEFIAFIDSDDWNDLEMYEKLYKKQQEKDYDIVFCGFNWVIDGVNWKVKETSKKEFSESNDITYLLRSSSCKLKNENEYEIKDSINCYTAKYLYKSKLLKNLRFNQNLSYSEDILFLLKLFLDENLKIGYIDDCLFYYFIHNNSLSQGKLNNIVEKSTKFLKELNLLLINTKYKNLIKAQEFFYYMVCKTNKLKFNTSDDLSMIKHWNSRENYKEYKKLCNDLFSKMKAFVIHHKLNFVYKFLYKIKK